MYNENIEAKTMRITYFHLLPFFSIDTLMNMIFMNKYFHLETLTYLKKRLNDNQFAEQFILYMMRKNLDFIYELKHSNNEIFSIILNKLVLFMNDNNFNINLESIFRENQ